MESFRQAAELAQRRGVQSDGSIWFTDPPFGLGSLYDGVVCEAELPACVYRIDADGSANMVADDVLGPNGLCFSPDESLLYVVESRGIPQPQDRRLRRGGRQTPRR